MPDTDTTPPTPQVVGFAETRVPLTEAFLRGLPSDATRSVYCRVLREFGTFLAGRPLEGATRRDVEAFRALLEGAGRAAPTVARALSALSVFYQFALSEGVIARNPMASARRPKLPDCSPRRALSKAEVQAMVAVPDAATLAGQRDRALVTVLAVQGLRISEALGLRVEDLDEEQGHRVAQVIGKGGKTARVPLAAATWQAVTAWTAAAGIVSGCIFVSVRKGGRVMPGRRISEQAAWKCWRSPRNAHFRTRRRFEDQKSRPCSMTAPGLR